MRSPFLAGAAWAALGAASWAGTGTWAISDRIPVAGDGGWDYVTFQPEGRLLYVTHQDRVAVLDTAARREIASIPGSGVHGVALAPELGRGFVSNGKSGTVTVFDLRTFQVAATLPAAPDADCVCYEPATRRVFAFCGDSGSATVIDAATEKVVATLPLGGKPEFAQVDGKGAVFDNLEDKDQVVRIDAATAQVTARWPLPDGSRPSSLGIDRERRRLFVGCRNQTLLVLDADSGRIVATVPIGAGVDATVYDPSRRIVYSSCGDGTVTAIRQDGPDAYAPAMTIPTAPRSRTLAIDAEGATLYLPGAEFGPPPPATADNPRPRPPALPGTFGVLVLRRGP